MLIILGQVALLDGVLFFCFQHVEGSIFMKHLVFWHRPYLDIRKRGHYHKNMKKGLLRSALILLVILVFCSAISPQIKKDIRSPKDLPFKYKKWLEEEVVYIITKKEREVFLSLQTDRERDIFIEAFWKQRDPTPNTPENEFRTEHYKRIKYANDRFGRESPGPGWRTEMGRIYIVLGEPKQIERYENETELYPMQVWYYDGMEQYGLPTAFYVVFFKKNNAGDYVLYSPIKDGSASLMWNYDGDPADYLTAYRTLAQINPRLAEISVNLIPGEITLGTTPSISSDLLLYSKIPSAPTYKVKDAYADKLLAYKDIVEVDYTANYIDSDYLAEVFLDSKNTPFVHYLIEPSRLSFEQYEDRFTANLEVNGNIVDERGDLVYQFERKIPIAMNSRQIASIQSKLFSFQDIIPVVPGKYKLNVIVKNTVSKEFTTIETSLSTPEPGKPWMSRPLLANNADMTSKYGGQLKPFLFKGVQLRPSPRNDFLQTDTMTVYIQLGGFNQQLKQEASLEIALLKEGERFKTIKRKLSEYVDPANIIEEYPLRDFPPAYYRLEASLLDASDKALITQKTQFYISPLEAIARPWVLSLPYTSPESPEISHILGVQLFNKKDLARALPLLESAYNREPSNPRFALEFARALFQNKDFVRAKGVADRFRESEESSFLLILGQCSQALGQYEEAISYFKTYLTRFGTSISALNSIGDSYLALGDKEEALSAFEKSLQLEPKQEKIRALVKSLKEKK